jgi:hypothetical protein
MKATLLTAVFFASALNAAFSQNLTVGSGAQPLRVNKTSNFGGSPYFNSAFNPSKIKTSSNKEFAIKALRYNVELQQLEYKENELVYAIQDSVISFSTVDSAGIAHQFVKNKLGKKDAFFQVVVPGKAELLKLYTAKVSSSEDWYTKKVTKTLVHTVKYYALKDGAVKELSKSGKDVLALFADRQEQMKDYLAKTDPNLKSQDGLSALFKYYNNLN